MDDIILDLSTPNLASIAEIEGVSFASLGMVLATDLKTD